MDKAIYIVPLLQLQ